MLSDEPATMAICFGPDGVLALSTINGGNKECITFGSLSRWSFQSSLLFLTESTEKIFSSFCQAVRWGLPPSVSQSAARRENALTAVTARSRRINPRIVFQQIGGVRNTSRT